MTTHIYAWIFINFDLKLFIASTIITYNFKLKLQEGLQSTIFIIPCLMIPTCDFENS